jgi:DNA-binding HxlR family transcriptional regulator
VARAPDAAFQQLADILGCKWTMAILDGISGGVNRPGRIERALPGLTTKILNDRVKKLERFGLIVRRSYPEVPPRVEYELTPRGRRLVALLGTIRRFAEDGTDE